MVNVYVPWPVGKPVPEGWERVDMVIKERVPKEPDINTVAARLKLSKLRRIVMGEEIGLEALAALAHRQWSGWMTHLFSTCIYNKDGSITIPADYVKGLQRQIAIPYEGLSEKEKESDRVEARRVLGLRWLQEEDNAF